MADEAVNFAKATLKTGISASATSITVTTGGGSNFPAVPFNAVVWNSTDYSDPSDDPDVEVVRVTARSGDVLTVTRAQESTAAVAHNTAGVTYKIIAGPTAKVVNDDLVHRLWTGPSSGTPTLYSLISSGTDSDVVANHRFMLSQTGFMLWDADGATSTWDATLQLNSAASQLQFATGSSFTIAFDDGDFTALTKLSDIACNEQSVNEVPTGSTRRTMFFSDRAIKIKQINAAVRGSTPSVQWTLKWDASYSGSGTQIDTATTTAADEISSGFDDGDIPAGSWIWIDYGTVSGTITEFSLTLRYHLEA